MFSSWTMMLAVVLSVAGILTAAADETSLINGGSLFWNQNVPPAKRDGPERLCGSRLVEVVRSLCKGDMFSGYVRRSDPLLIGSGGYVDDIQDLYDNNNSIDFGTDPTSSQYNIAESYWNKHLNSILNDKESLWPHSSKLLALKVLTEGKAHQRFRRHIHAECCTKPCTRSQLVKYCGSRSKRMAE